MTDRFDAVVIGAGHNGLVCASYLARAGMKVLVCDAGAGPGGMAAPRDFGTGYRVPSLAHVSCPVSDILRKDLDLDRHGYSSGDPLKTLALDTVNGPVTLSGDTASGRSLGDADIAAYRDFRGRYLDFASALAPLFENKPPRLKNMAPGDTKTLAKLGWKVRFGLGRDTMYEFLRVAAINIYDVLNETFDDERLKAAIAFDAVIGSAMGPRTPGTVLTWLTRLAGERNGAAALTSASLPAALVASAEAAGAKIRFDCPVARILLDDDRATGVELADGDSIPARLVVSAVDPRATFRRLVGAARLDAMFAHRVTQIRGAGVVGKLHLGLSGLPEFDGVDTSELGQRLLIAPSMRHIERAFNFSKYGECSEHPVFEITIPSLADASLAPDGHHVMSINVAYLPYHLKGGWAEHKPRIVDALVAGLSAYAPGLDALITGHEFLSPADIEHEYGAVKGHWHHGEMSIHQSFMLRPLYGAAQYDTPIDKLFLASAGCHPGGGLTGLPGRNAAQRILELGGAS